LPPDDERVGVPAVHAERVVAGLVDLVALEGDVVAADEAHPAVAALEVQPSDDQKGRVDDLDVVLVVVEVGGLRPRDDRRLAVGRTNRDRAAGGAVDGDGAPARLRIGAPVKDRTSPGSRPLARFSNSSLQEESALDGKISNVAACEDHGGKVRDESRATWIARSHGFFI